MGSNYERELRDRCYELGGVALRVPASGRKTTLSLPDVLGRFKSQELTLAIELKKTKTDYAYYEEDEIRKLREFASEWGATPALVARFTQDTSFYLQIAPEPSGSSISIKRHERDELPTLEEVVNEGKTDATHANTGRR